MDMKGEVDLLHGGEFQQMWIIPRQPRMCNLDKCIAQAKHLIWVMITLAVLAKFAYVAGIDDVDEWTFYPSRRAPTWGNSITRFIV